MTEKEIRDETEFGALLFLLKAFYEQKSNRQ